MRRALSAAITVFGVLVAALVLVAVSMFLLVLTASPTSAAAPLRVKALCAPDPYEYAFQVTLPRRAGTIFQVAFDPTFAGGLTFDYGRTGRLDLAVPRGGPVLYVRDGALRAQVAANPTPCAP